MAVEALDTFCHFFGGLCKTVAGVLHHDGVDNPERFATFMSNLPSGASYRTFVYYAQQINSGKMQLYDYGRVGNNKKYGTKEPPMVALKENYGVPTALLSGDMDHLADPVDVANTAADLQANGSLVFQKQYHADHFTFVIGKPEIMTTMWQEDVVPLINKYATLTVPVYIQ